MTAPGKWADHGFPKRGWSLAGFVDIGPETMSCEVCGHTPIRNVHILERDGHDNVMVGCVCAGKLTGDPKGAQEREDAMTNRAKRRANWITRRWPVSRRGHKRLKTDGYWFTVFPSKFGGYSASVTRIGDNSKPEYVRGKFATEDAAKLAGFDEVWPQSRAGLLTSYLERLAPNT
jgi:hypothetical protein